ncbi:hypothetical protein HZR84_13290 [Hyphobacterium sp. CCMP332]|nr:hypothetical protein HZR84_13290 [Hyphobacterium sp. CCMP332]
MDAELRKALKLNLILPIFTVGFLCLLSNPIYSQKNRMSVFHDNNGNCGYKNAKGEILLKPGLFDFCFSDSSEFFVSVAGKNGKIYAINYNTDTLFEIYKIDNGPDYISDGLFRFINIDKIGYSNFKGEIVIPAKFQCAFPFKNQKAKVSFYCQKSEFSEYKVPFSDSWFFIDKNGKRVD